MFAGPPPGCRRRYNCADIGGSGIDRRSAARECVCVQRGIPQGTTPEEHNMTPHVTEELPTRSIDWRVFVSMANTMPPRDPDEDDEDEDDEDEEDRADEPPVVREPDED